MSAWPARLASTEIAVHVARDSYSIDFAASCCLSHLAAARGSDAHSVCASGGDHEDPCTPCKRQQTRCVLSSDEMNCSTVFRFKTHALCVHKKLVLRYDWKFATASLIIWSVEQALATLHPTSAQKNSYTSTLFDCSVWSTFATEISNTSTIQVQYGLTGTKVQLCL